MTIMMMLRSLFLFVALFSVAAAFVPHHQAATIVRHALHMAPQFKNGRFEPTTDAEGPEAGYGVGKTFLLQGPKPAFTRIFQPDDYEQAVLKFMAQDKCDRDTAQGNMDAYLRNPQDWAFNRMEQEKKGIVYNYTDISAKQIALVLVWSGIVSLFAGRAVYSLVTGVGFVSSKLYM